MPFQNLPDRVDLQVLGASYLNALSENVEYVYGAGAAVRNMPFQGYRDTVVSGTTSATCLWYFRYRDGLDWLHYEVIVGGEIDYLRIKVNDWSADTTIFANETPGGGDRTFIGTADTSALVNDAWYQMWVDLDFVDTPNEVTIQMLVLADDDAFTVMTAAAYVVPKRWARGDTVNAADMNKYKSALDAAHGVIGDQRYIVPVRKNNTEDRGFFIANRYRWLHYIGDGTITDPLNVGDDVALTGDGANIAVYDLFNVDWLITGLLYEVEDCTFAAEDYLP